MIPVTLLTGFLGSGKTTLLRHALAQTEMADTAVLINEVGEIGLDHLLVDHVDDDTVLLASGCLCCAVRADLSGALRRLLLRRQAGLPFRRIVIETSGLADPAPIVATLASTGFIRDRCALGAVVTTVDAVHGEATLRTQPQAMRQVAFADRLVVTKTDLVDRLPALDHLNARAERLASAQGRIDPARLFAPVAAERPLEVEHGAHGDGIATFDLRWRAAVAWQPLMAALEALLGREGERVLRLKGVVRVAEQRRPMVIQGVQHTLFPPATLARDGAPEGSFLTFVTQNLPRRAVEPYFGAC